MPQGGKKTPFSGKLKKAQLQAKRERKVKNFRFQFWTNCPDPGCRRWLPGQIYKQPKGWRCWWCSW